MLANCNSPQVANYANNFQEAQIFPNKKDPTTFNQLFAFSLNFPSLQIPRIIQVSRESNNPAITLVATNPAAAAAAALEQPDTGY